MWYLNILAAFDNLTPMNWAVLEPALNFLWQGLLAIFVVIGLIILVVKLAMFVIVKIEERRKNKADPSHTDDNA